VVRGGVDDANVGACLLHVRTDGGEGGGEMVEGLVKRGSRVAEGEGDKLHPSPIFPEVRDEGGLLFGTLFHLVGATEVSTKTDFEEEDGALLLFERGRV